MTPFVSKAIDLYESIVQKSKLVFLENRSYKHSIIEYCCHHETQTCDFVESDFGNNEKSFLDSLTYIQLTHLSDIKHDFLAFQNHFVDYPIICVKDLKFIISFVHIEMGTSSWIQAFTYENVKKLAEIAERDGKGQGETFKLLLSEEEVSINVNKKKSLFEMANFYDKRNVLFFLKDNKKTHRDFTFPKYKPVSLTSSLYKDLWSSIKEAKKAGLQGGSVNLHPYKGRTQFYSMSTYDLGDVDNDIDQEQKITLKQEEKLQAIGRAVTNLYEEMREIAPVLKGLDRFYVDDLDETLEPHHFINAFHWNFYGCELKLLDHGALSEESSSFFNETEKEFKYNTEKVLGALSVIEKTPSKAWSFTMEEGAWLDENSLTSTPVPGKNPQEALYVSLALLASKRSYVSPNRYFRDDFFGKGYWMELAPK